MSPATAAALPIIGTLCPTATGYTATEPINLTQLAEVACSDWCRSMRTTDGPNSAPGSITYYLTAEYEGAALAVTGTVVGSN